MNLSKKGKLSQPCESFKEMEIILEKKDIKYKLLRVLNLIILIMLILLVLFFDIGLGKYERIFWCVPIITAVLLIADDILKDVKNNIFYTVDFIKFNANNYIIFRFKYSQ